MEVRRALHSGDVESAMERVNDLDPEVRPVRQYNTRNAVWQRCGHALRSGLPTCAACGGWTARRQRQHTLATLATPHRPGPTLT
jgi:hypothetical protein